MSEAGNPMADDGLIEAATNLTNFAWSAVVADCDESRDYLNGLVDALRSALARISRPSITAEAVAWQRFANVTNPPKWIDIDPAEKEEWVRLGYPIRALFAHPAEGAGYDPTTQPYDEPFRHVVSEGAGERDDKLLYNRLVTAGDTEPGDVVERLKNVADERLRAEPITDRGDYMHVYAKISRADGSLMHEAISALTSLRAERDEWAKASTDATGFALHWRNRAVAAEQRVAALEWALTEARLFVGSVAGENQPAREWAVALCNRIDAL